MIQLWSQNNMVQSASTPAWTPASLSGLQLWLDASDAATVTIDSGKVSQWNDKASVIGNATQSTPDNRPTYSSAAVNGRNAVTFGGSAWVSTPSVSINQPITAFVAFVQTDTSSFRMLFDSAAPRISMFNLSGTSVWYFAGSNQSGSCTISANAPHVQTVVFNGASSQIRFDKVQKLTADPGSNAAGGAISIGANGSGAFPFIGHICEMILVAGVLSAGDIATTEDYLYTRWGVA